MTVRTVTQSYGEPHRTAPRPRACAPRGAALAYDALGRRVTGLRERAAEATGASRPSAGLRALQDADAYRREADLDGEFYPVDSSGVGDVGGAGDGRARQRRDDADHERPEQADVLPARQNQAAECADDEADDDGADDA